MVVVRGCSYYTTCDGCGRVGAVVTTPILVMMVGPVVTTPLGVVVMVALVAVHFLGGI